MLEVMDFGLDSRFLEDWEALTEGRILALTDLDERRAGALTAAYRQTNVPLVHFPEMLCCVTAFLTKHLPDQRCCS